MSSVQFRSIHDVVHAFKSTGIVNWSIWQNKQYLHFKYTGKDAGESEELLAQTCKVLQQSAAIYTLKLYEGLAYNKSGYCTITRNTEDSGSFNFRFLEETYGNPSVSENRELSKQVAALTLELNQLKAEREADDDDDNAGIMGVLNGALENALPVILPGLIGKFFGGNAPATALAGVPGAVCSLDEAIAAMRAADPEVDKHLLKLGDIARDNPKRFKQLLAMMAYV